MTSMNAPPIPLPLPPPPPPPPSSALSLPPSNVVLLTHVPYFLKDSLREWIFPCGPTRTILKYDPIIIQKDSTSTPPCTFTALVTMMHGDGAWKLVNAIQHLQSSSDSETPPKIQAHLVPASPNVVMQVPELPAVDYPILSLSPTDSIATTISNNKSGQLSLDKVAAAAGGNNYDEDVDPLNAPAVLELVQKFRKSLETSQTSQQQRRMQHIKERLQQQIIMMKEKKLNVPPPILDVPPPLPPPPPVLQTILPPPPPLPQHLPVDTSATTITETLMSEQPPPLKKIKLDNEHELKAFISSLILQYLGEEETTLIEFCHQYVLDQKPWEGLLEELKLVLEEDAIPFVEAVKGKYNEWMGK